MMNYRWMLPAAAALVLVFLISIAKEGAPWPIYLGLVLMLVACVGLTMLFHNRDRSAPPVARPPGR
ncbi:MAG TPA: hypothetical protein VMB81_19190 [Candidatus Sulfotelmatobacter sp.]|nr:hypothetical protein [Candidatus Sulfotelmatobacter sp.]